MADFDYNNYVSEYTRVAKRFYNKKNKFMTSKTIIDVVLHNKDLVLSTKVINCPFSDHKYVVATLESKSTRPIEEFCNLRNLNVKIKK
jgi:nucleoside diphosphate kinase